jgi:hypothetical protein
MYDTILNGLRQGVPRGATFSPQSGRHRRCIVCTSCHFAPFWGAWPPLRPTPAVCPFFPGIAHGERPLQLWGVLPYRPPPTTTVTTIMATAALLRIMGGTRLPKCLHRCMGGVMLLLGMYPHLGTVVGPFPRAMGGISMRLHLLSRAWRLQARCFTLLFATGGSPFLFWI